MEFNDGSQFRIVTDPARYRRERPMFEFRATSRYKDKAFDRHRRDFYGFPSLMYHFPYQDAGSPEQQAEFFLATVGKPLDTDMYMLDTEGAGGLKNPTDFARRWWSVVESRTGKLCWEYVPQAFWRWFTRDVTGPRIIKAPRYSGGPNRGSAPTWQYDVHQYSDRGYFPGCNQTGDCNFTTLSVPTLLDRCNGGKPLSETKKKTHIILLGG